MPTRVYKFLEKQFALKTLYERRFKITKLEECNDPFDLLPFDLSNDSLARKALMETRSGLGKTVGLICFSAKCTNPVIWAHYSGKHTGICLGFDVPDPDDPKETRIKRIQYVNEPFPFPTGFAQMNDQEKDSILSTMLYTKFRHWAYEQEIRLWAYVHEEEDGVCYVDFDPNVTNLAEVILGANCTTPKAAIERALQVGSFEGVAIRKMRPASKGFCMELDPDW